MLAEYADVADFTPIEGNTPHNTVAAPPSQAPTPAASKPAVITAAASAAGNSVRVAQQTTNATGLSQRLSRQQPSSLHTESNSAKYTSTSELSCIQHVASTANMCDHSANKSHSQQGEDAWADEYSAFFPPEITGVNCANSSSTSHSGAGEGSLDDASMLKVDLPDFRDLSHSSCRDLDGASFAVSPLPQELYRHHQYHQRTVSGDNHSVVSDVLNKAMMMSDVNFSTANSAAGSVMSKTNSVFSMAPPARVTRNISENLMSQQSFNISSISPADGGTINSIDASALLRSHSYLSATDSRLQVCSSADSIADSMASGNVLNRAMIASYDADFSLSALDLQRMSASESTTGLSPFLHPQRGFSRSISDNVSNIITPKCVAYPMRTMFAPPPPPEVDARLPVVTATGDDCTASQQFDRSIEAAFASEHDISDFGVAPFDSTVEMRSSRDWRARSSVESLPPPPPPLEAYPTDLQLESLNNSAAFESDFPLGTDTSAGMFCSENDSVLQDTGDFDGLPSGSSSSKVSNNVHNTSGEQGSDAHSGNTTASSVLAAPTQLSGSVEYGGADAFTSNGYYNHLPMPTISSAPAVSNYLDFENHTRPSGGGAHTHLQLPYSPPGLDREYIGGDQPTASDSPSSRVGDIKQHLLEESGRKFRELRSFTASPSPHQMPQQSAHQQTTQLHSSQDMKLSPRQEDFQRLTTSSFPMELPSVPSFGSMHSMSYVYSTDSADPTRGSPRRHVHRHDSHGSGSAGSAGSRSHSATYDKEIGAEAVEEDGDGDNSQDEMDEISEDYDDYIDPVNVNSSMQSAGSRYTANSRMTNSMVSSNMSCSYTSSIDELHQVNPACKTSSWVQEHYPVQEVRSTRELHSYAFSGFHSVHAARDVLDDSDQSCLSDSVGIALKHKATESGNRDAQDNSFHQLSFNQIPLPVSVL